MRYTRCNPRRPPPCDIPRRSFSLSFSLGRTTRHATPSNVVISLADVRARYSLAAGVYILLLYCTYTADAVDGLDVVESCGIVP